MKFVNRKSELLYLEKEYQHPGCNFVVIYGRRRVGKTRLIKEFVQGKPHIYFLCDREIEINLLRRMKTSIALFLNDEVLEKMEVKDWDGIFLYLLDRADASQKIVIIIDEFQYLAKANPAIPSIFQRLWDEKLQHKNIFLILCGSLIHRMYNTTLSYKSPLYGRRTGQMKLNPIGFYDFQNFFPDLSFAQLVEYYAVAGGVPKYIEIFDPDKSIFENIEVSILNKNEYLYHEPRFILNEEVTEATNYFSILQTIAHGEHKIGNIAARLNISASNLTKYIEILIELDILERQVPVTEKFPNKSKKGLYFIKDNFFRFWCSYIFPFQSQLEMENIGYVLEKVQNSFSMFVAPIFESVSAELVAHWNASGLLPAHFQRWGRWWDRDSEIDVIALNEETKEILFCECKWTSQPVDFPVLHELREKAKHVNWFTNNRKEYFLLFSKSGFTSQLEAYARKHGILLADGFGFRVQGSMFRVPGSGFGKGNRE